MGSKNYFSHENISEIAGIDDHIRFIGDIIERYEWDSESEADIRRRYASIREKQSDKQFNMSVIGEFNSGKSSFINALLRFELLKTQNLQGTTVATTVIEYGSDYSVLVTNKKGRKIRYTFGKAEELRDYIEHVVEDDEDVKTIDTIVITFPSENLRSGFRIIDTPGTNSLETWHEDVTKHAINELSDISVVLTSVDNTFPQSLNGFISQTLEDVLPQCVFVVTKTDIVKPNELEMTLEHASRKPVAEFGIKSPIVLPYSSVLVLSDAEGEEIRPKHKALLQQSYNTETQLFKHMTKMRYVVQAKKLLLLIDEVYGLIREKLTYDYCKNNEILENLERMEHTELENFVGLQFAKLERLFREKADIEKNKALQIICDGMISTWMSVNKDILDKNNISDLRKYIEENINEMVDITALNIDISNDAFADSINSIYNLMVSKFELAFIEEYDLVFSDETMLLDEMKLKTKPIEMDVSFYIANPLREISEDPFQLVFPLLNLGIKAGYEIGIRLRFNKYKMQVAENINNYMDDKFQKARMMCSAEMNKIIQTAVDELETVMNKCLEVFKAKVEQMIREQRAAQRKVAGKNDEISRDISILETRKTLLQSIRRQLDSL